MGDLVKIMETRPLSKTKRWRLVEVVKKGEQALAASLEEDSSKDSHQEPLEA